MKHKVGTYKCGLINIDLFIRDGLGGSYFTFPDRGKLHVIEIGVDRQEWREVVGTLVHEAFEITAMHLALRFSPDPDIARDNGSRLFVMTHTQFSDVSARTGEFVSNCLPDLVRAYGRYKARRK